MQIKKLLILILFVPFLVHAQYNNWLDFTNWLTKESEDRSPIAVWRADYGITTVDTGGTYPTVSNWLSTNGLYDAYQPTADRRPLYNTDSVALKFDGVDDGLGCDDGGVFNPGTGDFSAFAWVYIPYEDANSKYILCKGTGRYTYLPGWRLYVYTVNTTSNYVTFTYTIGSSNYVIFNGGISIGSFTTGGWFHVGVVADRNDTYSLYINGNKRQSGDISAYAGENVESDYDFRIGQGLSSSDYFYHSFISEVRYYNIALTESEVQALYNAGRPQ